MRKINALVLTLCMIILASCTNKKSDPEANLTHFAANLPKFFAIQLFATLGVQI